jgi:flagellar basal-body rod protein FlgF
MPKGIYAAASAMLVETRLLESTARNLANAQTPGYRREVALRTPFAQVLAEDEGRTEGIRGNGGAGVLSSGSYFDQHRDGVQEPTGNTYDLALSGEGFFTVQDQQGRTFLTRAGHFQVDSQNRLTTPDGYLLLGQGGPITVPPEASSIGVDESGLVTAQTPRQGGGADDVPIDQLRLATVADTKSMAALGGVYFAPGRQALTPATPKVRQGAVERGNFDPIGELVQLVALQRRHDAAQRALAEQSRAGEGYSDMLRG